MGLYKKMATEKNMEEFVKIAARYEKTRDLITLYGLPVLTNKGTKAGRVKQVRLDKDGNFQGILVGRGLFRKPLYVGKGYIKRLERQAVLLDTHPVELYTGLPVITSDGKKFGKVIDVQRKDTKNNMSAFIIRRWFRKITIEKGDVKDIRASVMLEKDYEEAKAYFSR